MEGNLWRPIESVLVAGHGRQSLAQLAHLRSGRRRSSGPQPLPTPEGGTLLDLESVNVRYVTSSGFGVLLGQVPSAADCEGVALGWYYDDPLSPSLIMSCPGTCDTLNASSVAKVEALFGCETKLADVVK